MSSMGDENLVQLVVKMGNEITAAKGPESCSCLCVLAFSTGPAAHMVSMRPAGLDKQVSLGGG